MQDDERSDGVAIWMWALVFVLLGGVLGIWWGSKVTNERCCERTCDGDVYSCDDGDCLCNAEDGTIYRGWEPPE